jgi:divalent metal cation (Fe/Co/Zn/Cd) transporter
MATGWLWLDPVIAIAVALNILREGGFGWSGARPRA